MIARRIVGPMTAWSTIKLLRRDLAIARAAEKRQREKARALHQILARLEKRHRQGDADGVIWLVENWRTQLTKWAEEVRNRDVQP